MGFGPFFGWQFINGGFSDNGSAAVQQYGTLFNVTRGAATGVYKISLTAAFNALLVGGARLVVPVAYGDHAYANPGSCYTSVLGADGTTIYVYTYNSAGTQAYLGASTVVCEFGVIME